MNEELGIWRYVRYMDDMLLLGEPAVLRRVRNALADRLAVLGLSIKQGGVINHAAQGVPWLGFTLYPDRVRLNAPGRRRLRRRLRQLERADPPPLELQSRTTSLFAHARQADDVAWRRVVCRFSPLGDETTGKTRPPAERRARTGVTKADGRAPSPTEEGGA